MGEMESNAKHWAKQRGFMKRQSLSTARLESLLSAAENYEWDDWDDEGDDEGDEDDEEEEDGDDEERDALP